MDFIQPANFTGNKAWEALNIANIEGASVKLHWTDKPYIWHKNDGKEVLVVLDGTIVMHYKLNNVELLKTMNAGDICNIDEGDDHVAHPVNGSARILVIEKENSI